MKMLQSTFLGLLFFISILPARSQWIPCQGIEGAPCGSIVQQDTFLFIATDRGIFRRNLHSSSWGSACLRKAVDKLCSDGDALFWYDWASFRCSMDNGSTWVDLYLGGEIRDITAFDGVIFINDDYYGLMHSEDNGQTWDSLHPSSSSATVKSIFSQEGIVFCLVNGLDSVYRSDDKGDSWTSYPLTGVVEGGGHPYFYDENLWLARGNKFYKYNEGTSSWYIITDSLPGQTQIRGFVEESDTLFCYTNNGYYRLNSLGTKWIDCSEGLENRDCTDACRDDSTIYVATGIGPFSKTGTDPWVPQNNDLFGFEVSQAIIEGLRIYALANGKIYYSDDIENGFEQIETQGYCPAYDVIINGSTWYEGSDGGFSISPDSGYTWNDFSNGLGEYHVWLIARTNLYYYAVTYAYQGGLYRSKTYLNEWERVPNELGTMYFSDLDVYGNMVFAVGNNVLYRSNDFGTTFEAITEAGTGSYIFIKNNKIFYLRENDVIYSTDMGNTWQSWLSGIDADLIYCMDITNSEDTTVIGGFVGPWNPVNFLKIYTPENPEGIDIIDNLQQFAWSGIHHLLFDNGRLFICPNSGGLWYRDDLMVGIKDDDSGQDQTHTSLQLYPNPVHDFLTIDFEDFAEYSEYLIYDQVGRIIIRSQTGKNISPVTIDVSGLQPGVYFVVIRDNGGGSCAGKFVKAE